MGEIALLAAASYLLGSIPSGLLLARSKHIDVRATGSGNIGATNVARAAGMRLGLLTLLFDAAKGALPVLGARALDWGIGEFWTGADLGPVVAAVSALLGHCFPVTLGFRGGKGVATALGALLALVPASLPMPLAAFALVFLLSRRVSLASLVASLAAPAAASWSGAPVAEVLGVAAMSLVIVQRHRDNISRLLAGTEPRFERSGSGPRSDDSVA